MNERPSGNWWIENLLRPVVIAAMMVCLAVPVVLALRFVLGDWDGTYFLVFCFFAALEGILSERALQRRHITGYNYLASRGLEALILLLLLKVISYTSPGFDRLWADAQVWLVEPLRFFTDVDGLTGAAFLVLWMGALTVAREASELDAEGQAAAPPEDKTSTAYYLWLTQPPPMRDRQNALAWLGENFLWGGAVLLVAAAGFQVLNGAAAKSGEPLPFPLIQLTVPTLLYFALGIALLSQAQFAVMSAGWRLQEIPIQPEVGRRWLLWVVIFLIGVALLALALPTDYALGPISALYGLVVIVSQVVLVIFGFVVFVLALLVSLLFPNVEVPPRPEINLSPISTVEPVAGAAGGLPWLEVVLSALFWAAVAVIAGYALFHVLQERLGLLARDDAAQGTWWGRLLAWLRDLWQRWRAWRQEIEERLASRRAERRERTPVATRLARFFSLRGLSPRQLVRYFYLSTERRAGRAGQPRRPGQTPYEYRAALDDQFPDLEPDLAGLTEAFVEARYSRRAVEREDAEAVKPLWQRIKAALRRRTIGSRQSEAEEHE